MSNYLYTGQELDDELDLYNYNARLYNPTTGAFVSADMVGSGNRYSYAENNPLLFTDPTGHMEIAEGGGDYTPPLSTVTVGFSDFAPTAVANTTAVSSAQLSSYYYSPEYQQVLREQQIDFTIDFATLGLATYNLLASIPAFIAWLQFNYAYYTYSAPVEPALRTPVGDVMWMESATGETLSLDMPEEAWEEVYQASKMMAEEYGVGVYEIPRDQFEILNQLSGKPPGGEAAYIPRPRLPGDVYIVGENPARLKTVCLGHEFKHFQFFESAGFPAGLDGRSEVATEFDAYRFVFANRNILAQEELKKFVGVFRAMFGLD